MEQRKPLVIDTINWGLSISGAGAYGAPESAAPCLTSIKIGSVGERSSSLRVIETLPIVTFGFNSERYQGRNLALRLVALGYTNVYWYRGGREAWEVAGLPETKVTLHDW